MHFKAECRLDLNAHFVMKLEILPLMSGINNKASCEENHFTLMCMLETILAHLRKRKTQKMFYQIHLCRSITITNRLGWGSRTCHSKGARLASV